MNFKIEHHPQKIDYDTFRQLNDLCFPNEPVSEYDFQAFISTNFWAIHAQDNLIGYSVLTIGENTSHIRRIGVHPDFRSMGLATCLMRAMIDKANAMESGSIHLSVQHDNLPAIHLYRKFGFITTGESIQFSVPILPAVAEGFTIIPMPDYLRREDPPPLERNILKLAARHNPPHRFALVFLRKDVPVGFTCFSPDFPGCSPFDLFKVVDDIRTLVSLLGVYALPHKRTIKITTEDPIAIALFKSTSTKENYRLYEMTREKHEQ